MADLKLEYDFLIDKQAVNFAPKNQAEEILQNVITICTTPKGSRPMDREFGINPFEADKPMVSEFARLTNEIVSAVKKYEPRAKVTSVDNSWSQAENRLVPKVSIKINNLDG